MGTSKYAAVNTKIRGMEARFLNEDDYKRLLQSESVAEVAAYLKSTAAYGELLQKIDVQQSNRSNLEHILKSSMIRDVDSIINYFSGNYKKFIHTLYAKYEINDMKQLARRLYNAPPEYMQRFNTEPSLDFLGKYSGINRATVEKSESIADIIRAYENTKFYSYLKPILLSDNQNNLFRFETVLDISYYSLLMKESEELDASDQKLIKQAIGTISDLLNLQWIYRGKYFYDMMPAVLFNYTINAGYRFSKKSLRDLAYTPTLEAFQQKVRKTPYCFLIKNDDTTDSFMERRLERFTYYKLRQLRWSNSMTIIPALSHIILLEYQIRDIITLIEVIKYHLPPEEAKKYLIKYIPERT
jgi:V/A-type H+-transporting ATPase subunit C